MLELVNKSLAKMTSLIEAGKNMAGDNDDLIKIFKELEYTHKEALHDLLSVGWSWSHLRKRFTQRNRRPDEDRLERGKLVLRANRDGISWKQMASHILSAYPDWFPEYRNKKPSAEERARLGERLRKWARDAEKQAK